LFCQLSFFKFFVSKNTFFLGIQISWNHLPHFNIEFMIKSPLTSSRLTSLVSEPLRT
jgi:hypothetical protein